ncbi:polysaccharide biosynthesis/export family protein [Neolewinella antarctica]|uniref:Polysaccharide export outer membrane protein n=1 Tax=Neolewinella antarctica TaxID=442734 RepID=A0ABX0XCX7_9BACT|nr:polysaccharide biosynthesis/export family protein [Neolewinella antarctica]NJC26642.1 polysaccharide export outer membrane protein [Neolewinella antarctica]
MIFRLLSFVLTIVTLSSCVSHKALVNFNEKPLPFGQTRAIENALNITVQPNDLLRITVSSADPEAAAPFNLEQSAGQGNGQISVTALELFSGYLVDGSGNVDLPYLGSVRVEGLTTEQVKELIKTQLGTYLRNPVVTTRFLNFKVTVLGEVNTPGVVRLTNSRVTILDALGLAGDLTDYADRRSVSIIREEDNQRSFVELNLRRSDIFDSEYFYLKQNDVVYVQPIRAKVATVADPGQRLVSYGSALLTIITLIITLGR